MSGGRLPDAVTAEAICALGIAVSVQPNGFLSLAPATIQELADRFVSPWRSEDVAYVLHLDAHRHLAPLDPTDARDRILADPEFRIRDAMRRAMLDRAAESVGVVLGPDWTPGDRCDFDPLRAKSWWLDWNETGATRSISLFAEEGGYGWMAHADSNLGLPNNDGPVPTATGAATAALARLAAASLVPEEGEATT